MDEQLNPIGFELQNRLATARSKETESGTGPRINVPGVGSLVSTAYEQLRNAAEYTQEHLLRQKAIRRFYKRNLQFGSHKDIDGAIADELIIELTQAGYVSNNSQPVSIIDRLTAAIDKHYGNYWRMRQANIAHDYAQDLTLDLLSVECETLITEDDTQAAFILFAYSHYLSVLQKETFVGNDSKEADNYEISLYIAVHKALRKSDLAIVRFDMQRLQRIPDSDIHAYVQYYVIVDSIYDSNTNDRLSRYISRYGAPMRVLNSLIENITDTVDLLPHKDQFLTAYRARIIRSYDEARVRLDKGVVKSIIFLLISKALVGIAIEIPYDLLITGSIVLLPLLINLLTPIVYMVILRAGLTLPGETNTRALMGYAENMLYGSGGRELYSARKKTRYSIGFSFAYILMFVIVFGLVITQLIAWNFNIVQGAIFFIFLATASFLGFRLSRIVRELELVTVKPGIISSFRDYLYLPFILLGQWLSDKYARVNVIALVLDTVIELPLKTILRLSRQWADFLNEKRDEI